MDEKLKTFKELLPIIDTKREPPTTKKISKSNSSHCHL